MRTSWYIILTLHPCHRLLPRVVQTPTFRQTTWVPDAVIILIGPNDEMTKPIGAAGRNFTRTINPLYSRAGFVSQYKNLLTYVADSYDGFARPKIISVCGGSGNGLGCCDDIKTAQKQFNNQRAGFHADFVTITKQNWNMINGPDGAGLSQYNGCQTHYNQKGHRVLMQDVEPGIRDIMGW